MKTYIWLIIATIIFSIGAANAIDYLPENVLQQVVQTLSFTNTLLLASVILQAGILVNLKK